MAWLANRGFTQSQFDASGLVVDVSDSPIDNGGTADINHFALYKDGTISNNSPSRVVYNRLEGTPNSGSVLQAQDGHGNINAHIIAGQVNLSGSPHVDSSGYRYGLGVAPFVKVGGSIVFDTSTFTSPNYNNLAARAYRDGARVSGNSWGASVSGTYSSSSQTYDRLVRDAQPSGSAVPTAGNQQMTFVFAAGNDGSGASTVGAPGTAKNVITVGAAENVHPFGGSDGSGISDAGANSANDIISFSSRGPCGDQRKKPDIMAPGTHVTGGAPQAVKTMSRNGNRAGDFRRLRCQWRRQQQFLPVRRAAISHGFLWHQSFDARRGGCRRSRLSVVHQQRLGDNREPGQPGHDQGLPDERGALHDRRIGQRHPLFEQPGHGDGEPGYFF